VIADGQPGHIDLIKQINAGAVYRLIDQFGPISRIELSKMAQLAPASITKIVRTRAERLGGFCATLLQYGLPFRSEWIIECDYQHKVAADAAELLLRRYPKISAIVCHKASVAMGAYFGVLRTGNQVGRGAVNHFFERQVALISLEDSPEAELTEPRLTTIASSAREMGHVTAKRLLMRIAGQALDVQNIIVPPLLIERESA